jgi:LPS export ABC transporter protein LptC
MIKSFLHTYRIPVMLYMAGILFFACENDLDSIQKVTYDPNAPSEITRNLTLFYNDSGYAKVRIYATLAETYRSPRHITKLKDGLKVEFYSEDGEIVSELTALYGQINYETGIVIVRDSVGLLNIEKKQRLETEELFWNQKDSTVYTDKNVIIKSDDNSIKGRGRGLKTNQSFSTYKILQPVGKFNTSK